MLLLCSTTTVGGRNTKDVLVKIFDVGDISTAQPASTDNVFFAGIFLSIRRNKVQLLDQQNRQIDISVSMVVENMNSNLRLFILNSKTQSILSCANLSLKDKKINNETGVIYYLFDATYDNLMGHKNWTQPISFCARREHPEIFSIIMELGKNLMLELAGITGNEILNKTIVDVLK